MVSDLITKQEWPDLLLFPVLSEPDKRNRSLAVFPSMITVYNHLGGGWLDYFLYTFDKKL